MISYNDIYEYLRKERYSEQLQLLPKKFLRDVADYIADKKSLASQHAKQADQAEFFSDEITKMKKQLENAVSVFNELMLLRKKKLLSLAFVASETGINKRDFENMIDLEKDMFDKIMVAVQEAEKKLSSNLISSGGGVFSDEMKLVLFFEDLDEFMGLDGKSFGPFKKDEVTMLPKMVAEILVGDKKAEIVLED